MSKHLSFPLAVWVNGTKSVKSFLEDMGAPLRKVTLKSTAQSPFTTRPSYIALTPKKDGLKILQGQISASGKTIDIGPNANPWTMALPSENFARHIHSFSWLHELAPLGDAKGGIRARQLVDDWILVYGYYNSFAWRPDILAPRVFAMLSTWDVLLFGDKATAPAKLAARRSNLSRQIFRLAQVYKQTTAGLPRLKAAGTLALAGAMIGHKSMLDKNLDRLDDLLETQILGDGGHISRRPAAGVEVLQLLLAIEHCLKSLGIEGSKQTRRAIDRLVPTLGFFNIGDGKLASFNGSGEGDAKIIKAIVKAGNGTAERPFGYMPHSGYQRLDRNGTVVIMDTGETPPPPYNRRTHLGPLAVEIGTPSGRLVVNCGFNTGQSEKWQSPMRETAAHSTLVLDECSSGECLNKGARLRAFGPAITKGVLTSSASRQEQDEDIWLEATHDGYRKTTGLNHRRRIYMREGGHDIRGEDTLYVPMGSAPVFKGAKFPYALRFHLHPSVRATLSRDSRSALIIMPNGTGWRFRTDNGPLNLEKSIYLAAGARPQRCEQLIIRGNALSDNNGEDKSNQVRWSFKQVPTA